MPSTLIIGAGLAGLSCARHLQNDALIVEKESEVGGTARTIHRQGFAFDLTGHWLHLNDPDIKKWIDQEFSQELTHVQRRAAIHSFNKRTPYPFQANTFGLPTPVVAECLLGYFRAREAGLSGNNPEPKNFEDFIRTKMGDGIARHFMIPYNTKLWTVSPSQMAHNWCGRFVPTPNPEEVVWGALTDGGQGAPLGYNSSFYYPKEGGIGRMSQALEHSLKTPIEKANPVKKIDWQNKKITTVRGQTLSYRFLASTLPLSDLLDTLENVPEAIKSAQQLLRATSVTYWDIGLRGANSAVDPHWIYFPEPQFPFYRVGSASAAVAQCAPSGCRSMYVEVSHPRGTTCSVNDSQIRDGLIKAGLLQEHDEPLVWEQSKIDCAYVIMDMNYGKNRQQILDWLKSQHIWSFGRYGAWTYDSMEGAMLQGRHVALEINRLAH